MNELLEIFNHKKRNSKSYVKTLSKSNTLLHPKDKITQPTRIDSFHPNKLSDKFSSDRIVINYHKNGKSNQTRNIKDKIEDLTETIKGRTFMKNDSYLRNTSNNKMLGSISNNYFLKSFSRLDSISKTKKYAESHFLKQHETKSNKCNYLNVRDKINTFKEYLSIKGALDNELRTKLNYIYK
jgi:hypothetical protein